MVLRRSISVILLLSVLCPPGLASDVDLPALACPTLLAPRYSEWIAFEFRKLRAEAPPARRLLLAGVEAKVRKRILAAAAAAGSAQLAEKDLRRIMVQAVADRSIVPRQAVGYTALVALMVSSAVVTNYFGDKLPSSAKFLTTFITQITTIGVFMLGARIWEPMSATLKKFGFWLAPPGTAAGPLAGQAADPFLGQTWESTQGTYDLNQQIASNRISQFLLAFEEELERAYRAMHEPDAEKRRPYVIDQLAFAAVRLRMLSQDLSMDLSLFTAAVRTGFSDHVPDPASLRAEVRQRIDRLDPKAQDPGIRAHYDELLRAWLD